MKAHRIVETDVIVVGGGIAGSRTALAAARQGAKVTLITKGVYGSGTSVGPVVLAGAGPWSTADDSRELHFEGIVVTGRRFLVDQELARVLAEEAPDRIMEMESFDGHLWDRGPDGRIEPYFEFSEEVRLAEESHHYHRNRYVSCNREGMYNGYTGMNVLQRLKGENRRLGVRVMEETAGFRLLTAADGSVTGVIAFDYLRGELVVIRAKATVIATGSISQLWYPWGIAGREMTGEGVAMALSAGALIADIELIMTAYLPSVSPAWSGRHKLLQSVIECAPGFQSDYQIRWVNAAGEAFMKRYMPQVPDSYEAFYLAVVKGVQTELDEGRGPLYMDYSSLPRPFMEAVAPFIVRYMDKLGQRQGDFLLEVGPNPMWSFGGIKIDEWCRSSVPGLFACGDASNAVKDGFGASVACGVTTGLVFGKRAGEAAAARSREMDSPPGNSDLEAQLREVKTFFERITGRADGISPLALKLKIGDLMRRHLHLKHESGMNQALAGIMALREDELPQMRVSSASGPYHYELMEAIEIPGMLDMAEVFIRASLMRKESRRHLIVREDYPHRDDANWLKHIVIEKQRSGFELSTVPVALTYFQPDETGVHCLGRGK